MNVKIGNKRDAMKRHPKIKKNAFIVISLCIFGFLWISAHAELIKPSRSLKSTSGGPGSLTVFSEPPGQDVKLDGSSVGSTPIRVKTLDPGIHRLQVGGAATEIYIEPGHTFHISLFRDRFIKLDVTQNQAAASTDNGGRSAVDRRASQETPQQFSTNEENRKAWKRWMQFVDGTSKHF